MNEQDVSSQLVGILTDMTSDWDIELDSDINRETRLIADLEFESIDIVELVVAIEQTFKTRGIPFERLLMVDGRYVDDLSVAQVSDFVAANL
jgi:acyl carrier protein